MQSEPRHVVFSYLYFWPFAGNYGSQSSQQVQAAESFLHSSQPVTSSIEAHWGKKRSWDNSSNVQNLDGNEIYLPSREVPSYFYMIRAFPWDYSRGLLNVSCFSHRTFYVLSHRSFVDKKSISQTVPSGVLKGRINGRMQTASLKYFGQITASEAPVLPTTQLSADWAVFQRGTSLKEGEMSMCSSSLEFLVLNSKSPYFLLFLIYLLRRFFAY